MNLPNQLTLARLVVTLPFVAALSVDWRGTKTFALCLFLLASLTDYADGIIARRYNLVTVFGQLMDPLVDKVMTMAAFIGLVALHDIPAWVVIVIVSRESLLTYQFRYARRSRLEKQPTDPASAGPFAIYI